MTTSPELIKDARFYASHYDSVMPQDGRLSKLLRELADNLEECVARLDESIDNANNAWGEARKLQELLDTRAKVSDEDFKVILMAHLQLRKAAKQALPILEQLPATNFGAIQDLRRALLQEKGTEKP